MANWNDFKSYFSPLQIPVVDAFIAQVQIYYGISDFSEIYKHTENDLTIAISDLISSSPFYTELGNYIYNKTTQVVAGPDDNQNWDNYILQFDGDLQDAIKELVRILKATPYGYTFAAFKSGQTGTGLSSIFASLDSNGLFFFFLGSFFKNRYVQSTDGFTVMENLVSGEEQLRLRELFYQLRKAAKFDQFEKLVDTSLSDLANEIKLIFSSNQGNNTYVDFISNEFNDKINSVDINLPDRDKYQSFLSSYSPSKMPIAQSLYQVLVNMGLLNDIGDYVESPLSSASGVNTELVLNYEGDKGIQVQLNPDFKEYGHGWFDINRAALSDHFVTNEKLRLIKYSESSTVYSSPVLVQGKSYVIEIDVFHSSDPGNTLEVFYGTVLVGSFNNPSGKYSFNLLTSGPDLDLKFNLTSTQEGAVVQLESVYIFERLPVFYPSVIVQQEADINQSQLTKLFPYSGVQGEEFLLEINGSPEIRFSSTGNYGEDLISLASTINSEAAKVDSPYSLYSAEVISNYVLITGPTEVVDIFAFTSIKSIILSLPINHEFYAVLAEYLKTLALEAIQEISKIISIEAQVINNGKPLTDIQVRITDLDYRPLRRDLGSYFTNGSGFIRFDYKLIYPARGIRKFNLELFKGNKVLDKTFEIVVDAQEPVMIQVPYFPSGQIASPEISSVASQINLTISSELNQFLIDNQIYTLADIKNKGGLKYLTGLPIAQDSQVVVTLDAHAALYSVSKNILANQALIEAGITSPLLLGQSPRKDVVANQETNGVGSFRAAQNYYVSKTFGSLLHNILTAHLSARANNISNGQLNELDPIFTESCSCKDCNSGVSPIAYLADLINYTLLNVKNEGGEFSIEDLENTFFQDFRYLPHSCDSVESLVCQQRIAVEILRRYLSHLESTLQGDELSRLQANYPKFQEAVSDYCFSVYKHALSELGTSFEQIREIKKDTDQKKLALARSLGLPFNEAFDPFASGNLFLDPDASAAELTEGALEELFGIVDTQRDPYSTGYKSGDTLGQISRWVVRGVEYGKNVDEEGYIYLSILSSGNEVRFYKDALRTQLVGTASGINGKLTISPENESSLTGEIYIENFVDSEQIKISLIPRVQCWRLQSTNDRWYQMDWPENRYKSHIIPIIDPDLVISDDFRNPDPLNNSAFKIWKNRRIWVDEVLSGFLPAIPSVPALLDLMNNPVEYLNVENQQFELTPWPVIPSFSDLQNLYKSLNQGTALDPVYADIDNLYLDINGFKRLFEIYSKTRVNDQKGILVRIEQIATASLAHEISLTPGTIRTGDKFEVTFNGSGSITVTANTPVVQDFLGALEFAINGAGWPVTVSVESNSLVLQHTSLNTIFSIKAKTFRSPSQEELNDLISILGQAIKQTFKAVWIAEENLPATSISINSKDFWKPVTQPVPGIWPPLVWDNPIIDPDLINISDMSDPAIGKTARQLYYFRRDEIGGSNELIKSKCMEEGLSEAFEYSWGENYLGSYVSLEEIYLNLNDSDQLLVEAALEFIKNNLKITLDEFKLIISVYDTYFNVSEEQVSEDQWNTIFGILTSVYKKRVLYATWKIQEESLDYWQVLKAKLPQWRSSADARLEWDNALEDVSRNPIIDPDLIRPDYFANLDLGEITLQIFNSRKAQISGLYNQIKQDLEAQATLLEGLDYVVGKYIISSDSSSALKDLLDAGESGADIAPRLMQLNLTFAALKFLVSIRNLLISPEHTILDEEKESIVSILVQVQKERLYSDWLKEEQAANLILSPRFFKKAKYSKRTFGLPGKERVLSWRVDANRKRSWLETLEARIVSKENIFSFFKDIAQSSDDKNLLFLRDELIKASIYTETEFKEQAEKLTEKLLTDFENNCCQNTTRTAQAIEALQLLFFSIRTGQIKDEHPELELNIESDYFDEEWKWMGSYATWRAAMFINLYPENVLGPEFVKNGSEAFYRLIQAFRDTNRLTPGAACSIVDNYYEYFKDITNLSLEAHASVNTLTGKSDKSCGYYSQNSSYKEMQFLFAISRNSKKMYYTSFSGDDTGNFSPAPWALLSAFQNISITSVLGARVWTPGNNKWLVVFINGYQNGNKKVFYAKYDLTKGFWSNEAIELDITSDTASPVLNRTVTVGSFANTQKLYLASIVEEGISIFELNEQGTKLEEARRIESARQVYDLFGEFPLYVIKSEVQNGLGNEVDYYRVNSENRGIVQERLDLCLSSYQEVTLPRLGKYYEGIRKEDGHKVFLPVNKTTFIPVYKTTSANKTPRLEVYFHNVNTGVPWYYLGGFKWDNTYYAFGRNYNSDTTSYRIFNNSSNLGEYPFSQKANFISFFQNNNGKSFLIYETKSGIFVEGVYKDPTGKIFNSPSYPPVKLNYSANTFPVKLEAGMDPDKLKSNQKFTYPSNSHLPRSLASVLDEAYYFVPMMTALSLQAKGYYNEALDWYKLVYPYDKKILDPVDNQIKPLKVWYGLEREEKFLDEYKRAEDWLKDPLDPHGIAQTRANTYTRFTIMSISRCFMEYADSEFTKDTAESVPRARLFYDSALELLELEKLYSDANSCTTIIENLKFEPSGEPDADDWPYWMPVWIEIKEDLYKIQSRDVLQTITGLIESTIQNGTTLSGKITTIRDIVDDAFETPEEFTDLGTVIASGRSLIWDSLNRLLANGDLQNGLEYIVSLAANRYLNAVTNVTGILPEALTSDSTIIGWFSAPAKLHAQPSSVGSITSITGNLPVNVYFVKKKAYYYHTNPTPEQIQTLNVLKNPIEVIKQNFKNSVYYTPQPNPAFCVPPNPVLQSLVLSIEANLYKIRNCMNIAGMIRELLPYAAPTDQSSGIPVLGGDGVLLTTGNGVFTPTIYRYEVLVDRAKQHVNIAQQIESTLLALYEKEDAERYTVLKARQDLALAKAGVRLQNLRMKEAESGIILAELQRDKVTFTSDHFRGLIDRGLLGSEALSLSFLTSAAVFQSISASLSIASSALFIASVIAPPGMGMDPGQRLSFAAAATGAIGSSFSSASQALSMTSSVQSMLASFERRQEDWQFQLELAQQDLLISDQQIRIANQQYQVVDQEQQIAELQVENANEIIEFLINKFTNAELYDWMAKTLEKVYSYFLYQATSTAKVAEKQLTFERQEQIPIFIKDDYWEAPSSGFINSGTGPDRRGLTGSFRLLQDISEMDQYAFDTEKRKLQLTKTFSLLRLAPTQFQEFKETGRLFFGTSLDMFDRDFPGHFLRLIKKVKVTVVALIPPVSGINATLRNSGISYIVNGSDFRKNYIVRSPDSISFTSPVNATGVFEMQEQQSGRLNPFENIGVETNWELIMPKAANFFDYNSIADVYITFEYTALESSVLRKQVIESLDTSFSGDRPFSFKGSFADQWYDLSNPSNSGNVSVFFSTLIADFPANIGNLKIAGLSMYFATTDNNELPAGKVALAYKRPDEADFPISLETNFQKVLIAGQNAAEWAGLIEGTNAIGDWKLSLGADIIKKIKDGRITDIILNLSVSGVTPEWPNY